MSFIQDLIFSKNPAAPLRLDIFPENTREQCWQAFYNNFFLEHNPSSLAEKFEKEKVIEQLVKYLRQEIGVRCLVTKEIKERRGNYVIINYTEELYSFFKEGFERGKTIKDINYAFWVLESLVITLRVSYAGKENELEEIFNKYLRQAGIGYNFVDGKLIPYVDQNLLETIISPTFSLLQHKMFKDALGYFIKSFEDFKIQSYESAMDNIGKAYEAVIKIILLRKGLPLPENPTLNTLIESIRKHKLIPGIDGGKLSAHNDFSTTVFKYLGTVPELRNKGAGHSVVRGDNRTMADSKMVLLAMHHAAANILYLAQSCLDLSQ